MRKIILAGVAVLAALAIAAPAHAGTDEAKQRDRHWAQELLVNRYTTSCAFGRRVMNYVTGGPERMGRTVRVRSPKTGKRRRVRCDFMGRASTAAARAARRSRS